MDSPERCPLSYDGDAVHQYAAGTLPPGELDAFEQHMLVCVPCQTAVREAAAVRGAFRAGVPGRAQVLRWSLPLGLAALLALWLARPSPTPLERLGAVGEVPRFEGVPVRAATDSATALADRGMAEYVRGDFRETARLLGAAADLEASPAVSFFLGIARLKAGAPDSAIAALAAALKPEGNPYAPEARLYLAKGWLRLGRADSALAQLAAISTGSRLGAHAAALADSIREVQRR